MPQIEVAFDIDANGILHVSAKDKATGKESKITIKANSGLTEAEIQKMVRDAAAHAEDDRRLKTLAERRNAGEALAHATRKSLAEYGARLDAAERAAIEQAIGALDTALKGNDQADIDARIEALSATAQKLGAKMYAGTPEAETGNVPPQQDDVVDADFREAKH